MSAGKYIRKYLITLALVLYPFLSGSSQSVYPEFLYNNKDLAKASAYSQRMFADHPDRLFVQDYILGLGVINYYSNQPIKAERYFLKSLRLAKDSVSQANVYYWLGRSQLMQDKADQAAYYFKQALNYDKNPGDNFLFFYGIALYKIQQYEDAINCLVNYKSQMQEKSLPAELPFFIGAAALGEGDYTLAEENLSQSELQMNTQFSPKPTYLLGLNYYLDGEKEKSLNTFKRIISDTATEFRRRAHLISGTIYSDRGDVSKAISEFDSIIADTSDKFKDQAFLRSGIAYLQLKKSAKAMAQFDTLISRYPSSSLKELAMYYQAQIYRQDQKWSKAKTEFRKLIAMYPQSALTEQARVNLGRVLYNEENYVEAIPLMEDFLNDFPASTFRREILFKLIQSCHILGKTDKEKTYGEKFIREFPSAEEAFKVHYQLGQIGFDKKDYYYAQRHFIQITSNELYPYALKGLGDVYYALDSLSLSVNYYDFAEQVSTDTLIDEIRYNRELAYLKQKRYVSNIEMLRSFLAKYQTSRKAAMVQYEIGQSYQKQGDAFQAITEFDKVKYFIASSQYVPMAEMGKAQSYTILEQLPQAIESYLKVVNDFSTVPYLPQAIWQLATLYSSVQKYDSAIIFYSRLVNEFPKAVEKEKALIELAKTYQSLMKFSEAVTLFERFIKSYPRSEYLRQAYLYLTDCYQELGDYTNAEKTIKNILDKFGKTGEIYYKLGEINVLQNKLAMAQSNFIYAHNAYVIEQKTEPAALSLFQAGKSALAIKKWSEAKDLFLKCMKKTQDERLRIECENQLKLIQEP